MKNTILLILFLVIYTNAGLLLAADGNVIIDDYSYKDGLKTSWVYSVFKDSKGFLWICSNNGLFRYDGYSFRHINTMVKGFFNQETYSITEDQEGNFLLGTQNGAYFYNTRKESLFRLQLSTNRQSRIFQTLIIDNTLFLASDSGLVLIRKPDIFTPGEVLRTRVLLPDSLRRISPQDNIINALCYVPGDSSVWIGSNGALYELRLKTNILRLIESYKQKSIRDLSVYNNQIMASSWDGGVFTVNRSTCRLQSDSLITFANTIVGDKRVVSALADQQNRLWIATFGNGLYVFSRGKSGEITYVNYRNDHNPRGSLKSDFVNDLFIDNSGIVWIGQMQPALSKLYYQKSKFITYNLFRQNEQYTSREIRSVNQSSNPDKLWISTNGSGLFLFDTRSQEIIQFTDQTKQGLQLPGNKMNFCYQDRHGNLWMVFQRLGLYVVPAGIVADLLKGTLKTLIKPFDANRLANMNSEANSYILSLYMDRSERLWAGGWGSLHMINLKGDLLNRNTTAGSLTGIESTCVFSFDNYDKAKIAFAPVASIAELGNNKIILGTLGSGLVEVETTLSGHFRFRLPEVNASMSTRNVRQVYKDKQNNIWMGTHAGLYFWNTSNDSLKLITAAQGLCSDDINNIIQDNDANIWVSTSFGISKILSSGCSIANFYYTDKDKFNQYIINAAVHTSDNLIGFSTNETMVFIHPDSIERDQHDPPLFFTDIKIDNKAVIPLEKYFGTRIINAGINDCKVIRVPHNHTLSIEFAALDFVNAGKLMYKYRLDSNAEWVVLNASQRSLVIPKLRSGEYTLSVMLADSHEQQIRTIVIDYLPPFWLTLPAYFVYFLMALAGFFLYRRLLIRKVLQQSILEKERFERKKVEELDKMKTEFFSNISHELRTPLSLIINPLESITKDEELSLQNREKLNLVLKSSNRLLKLTNELMDFSKIDNNLLKPDFQLHDIVSLVNDSCQLFNNLAGSMNLDFKIICSFERMEIPMDKGMIEKVIFNLLSNAFKYTPAKGMVMVNLTKSQWANNEHIKFSVINTGEGIKPEDLNKVFDRFYQVRNDQNSTVQGTGIGLALVKSFVELHNGMVEVKSEPGLETSFDIYLPLTQAGFDDQVNNGSDGPFQSKEKLQSHESKSHGTRPETRYRLLLIEDEEDISQYITRELAKDFEISVVANGEEGLKMAGEIIPDLIITDVKMPVLSGLELCKMLKNQVITSHIPVIMLSAKASVEEQIEGLETGADVYMVKPFSIDHLKAQIISLISFKQAVYQKNLKETSLVPEDAMPGKLDAEFLQKITAFIEANLTDSNLSVDQLAQCVSLSKVQTYRKIKAISGLSIVEFIRTIRLKKAAQLILENRLTFSEISFETGFSTPSYFSKCFHDHFGQTPSEFAASNSGR